VDHVCLHLMVPLYQVARALSRPILLKFVNLWRPTRCSSGCGPQGP
jgi:hypothetical protein